VQDIKTNLPRFKITGPQHRAFLN